MAEAAVAAAARIRSEGAGLSGWRLGAMGLAVLGWMAAQLQQPALWPAPTHRAMLALGLLWLALGAAAFRRRSRGPAWIATVAWGLLCCGLATVGFATTALRAADRLADRLDPSLEGADLVVTGVVAEIGRASCRERVS
jgi:competence protein ComEC